MSPTCLLAAFFLFVIAAVCGAEETPAEIPSPDGKFVFQFVEPDEAGAFGSWKIVDKEKGQTVWQSPEDANVTWVRDTQCLWSPDSKQFALNYQAGSRYEVTQIYRFEGKTFVALPSFESLLAARLEEIKGRQLRELVDKLPPSFSEKEAVLNGSFQRRLWDQYRVRRWIDDNTLDVTAYSIRHITTPDSSLNDEEVSATLRFVIRRDRDKWKILEEKVVPIEETE